MPLSELIQRLIHMLEVGAVSRYLRIFALALGVISLAFLYDIRAYRNLAAPEAMDAAQLARNLSEGKGYTTLLIRPFSLYLVQRHNEPKTPVLLTNATPDFALIKTAHPDLANPPVYPLVLAGLMKILPFNYPVNLKSPFWANNGSFWRYQPDFLIALFNEMLLFIVALLTFFLAKKLFDSNVAWVSAILVLGCELLWRFSTSGLSTMLLLAFFLGLTLLLLEIEKSTREVPLRTGWLFSLAMAAGILTGIGALTRYAFGWTIIPVAVFLLLFSGPKRMWHTLAALAAFALVLTPWIIRNEAVSGTAFGTAGYAVVEGTYVFPSFQLQRSLHPDLARLMTLQLNVQMMIYLQKLIMYLRGNLTGDLLYSGATWAGALFFAGLFLGFRSSGTRRLRYFLLMCLPIFVLMQGLGRTQLSEQSPGINSENLLVLLVPLVFVFGASFFFTLLDQMTLPLLQLRYAITAGFVALCCLPLAFALLPPRTPPVVYPPYFPPEIQRTANWMKPDELMMSDVPWAVAWYGHRQCVWLSLDAQTEFLAINDNLKPVNALYLTPLTMDGKFFSDLDAPKEFSATINYLKTVPSLYLNQKSIDAKSVFESAPTGDSSWGNFIVDTVVKAKIPPGFPLNNAGPGILPDRLFLTDRQRW
jgi:Dolichyl-phosphate-mannose-protein mannosyltransferase